MEAHPALSEPSAPDLLPTISEPSFYQLSLLRPCFPFPVFIWMFLRHLTLLRYFHISGIFVISVISYVSPYTLVSQVDQYAQTWVHHSLNPLHSCWHHPVRKRFLMHRTLFRLMLTDFSEAWKNLDCSFLIAWPRANCKKGNVIKKIVT